MKFRFKKIQTSISFKPGKYADEIRKFISQEGMDGESEELLGKAADYIEMLENHISKELTE